MSISLMDAAKRVPTLTRKEAEDPYLSQKKLTRAEKILLIHLANYDKDGDGRNIFPKIQKIVDETGMSRRSVLMLIKSLKQKGYLIKVKDPSCRSVHYHIPLDQFGDVAPRPPVLTEEEAFEIEHKKQKAATTRLQATISHFVKSVDAGDISEDQWSILAGHGIGRSQPDLRVEGTGEKRMSERERLAHTIESALATVLQAIAASTLSTEQWQSLENVVLDSVLPLPAAGEELAPAVAATANEKDSFLDVDFDGEELASSQQLAATLRQELAAVRAKRPDLRIVSSSQQQPGTRRQEAMQVIRQFNEQHATANIQQQQSAVINQQEEQRANLLALASGSAQSILAPIPREALPQENAVFSFVEPEPITVINLPRAAGPRIIDAGANGHEERQAILFTPADAGEELELNSQEWRQIAALAGEELAKAPVSPSLVDQKIATYESLAAAAQWKHTEAPKTDKRKAKYKDIWERTHERRQALVQERDRLTAPAEASEEVTP